MFDEFLATEKAHIPEPELVPILDALTAVIFFLLLSTTFLELTKITVPPSQTSVISDPVSPPPAQPKIFVKLKGKSELLLTMRWGGSHPHQLQRTVARMSDNARSPELEKSLQEMVADFKRQYPDEKAVQLALSEAATYQEMVSAMDGIRTELQDIVLISYEEVATVN